MPYYGWLGGPLAATVLAAAAYSAGRVVVGPLRGRRVHYDVDITHALMGASMAGMFVANLSFLSTAIWKAAFAVIIASYAIRAILGSRSQRIAQRELLYQTGYLLSVSAMLYMLHAVPSATAGATEHASIALDMTVDMAMASARADAHAPALALLFAALLLVYVVLVANRVRSMAAAPRAPGPAARDEITARQAVPAHIPAYAYRLPLAPRAGAACEIVMCVAMTVMLITAR